jgi:hypothetical protein
MPGKFWTSSVSRFRMRASIACDRAGRRAECRPAHTHLTTGIANSAPLPMLSGQRCMTLL